MDFTKLNNIKEKNWFDNLLIIFSLLLPGITYFYFFEPKIFFEIEITKLLLLAILYSLPPTLLWRFAIEFSFLGKKIKKTSEKAEKILRDIEKIEISNGIELKKMKNIAEEASNSEYYIQRFASGLTIITLISVVFTTSNPSLKEILLYISVPIFFFLVTKIIDWFK